MMKNDWIYNRGDIYRANLNPFTGSEQGGTRPVIVLQNNKGNFFCPTLIIAPLTTKTEKYRSLPTHYLLKDVDGLPVVSLVLLEQIRAIDKSRIQGYLGKAHSQQMREIDEKIQASLGLYIPEEVEAP